MKVTTLIKLLERKLDEIHTYTDAVKYVSGLNDELSRKGVLEELARVSQFDVETLNKIVPVSIKRRTIENGINKLLKEQRATN